MAQKKRPLEFIDMGGVYTMRVIIRIVVVVLLLIIFNGYSIFDSFNLANNGIFTDGKVLCYAPYKALLNRSSKVNNYKVSYDGYTGDVVLWGMDHPTNSKVSVVYDKNNPNLVWLGNHGDNAWKLYKLNYDPQWTIIALIISFILYVIEIRYCL